jgi:hypothetical protein
MLDRIDAAAVLLGLSNNADMAGFIHDYNEMAGRYKLLLAQARGRRAAGRQEDEGESDKETSGEKDIEPSTGEVIPPSTLGTRSAGGRPGSIFLSRSPSWPARRERSRARHSCCHVKYPRKSARASTGRSNSP